LCSRRTCRSGGTDSARRTDRTYRPSRSAIADDDLIGGRPDLQLDDAILREIEKREGERSVIAGRLRKLSIQDNRRLRAGRPSVHHETPTLDRDIVDRNARVRQRLRCREPGRAGKRTQSQSNCDVTHGILHGAADADVRRPGDIAMVRATAAPRIVRSN
jgi:hypothetical protein